MTYATQQDLIDRFGEEELIQLTDRAGLGAVESIAVARALADAEAEIDSYLVVRYAVPVAPAPAMLVRVACDVARYRLYANAPTQPVRVAYEDAVKFLRDVAAGKASLGAGAESLPAQSGGTVQFEPGGRVFARDNL